MGGEKHIFDRFAVIFSVIIVWVYAHLLSVGGAYKHSPRTTQMSCRTDRAGSIGAAPWYGLLDYSEFLGLQLVSCHELCTENKIYASLRSLCMRISQSVLNQICANVFYDTTSTSNFHLLCFDNIGGCPSGTRSICQVNGNCVVFCLSFEHNG